MVCNNCKYIKKNDSGYFNITHCILTGQRLANPEDNRICFLIEEDTHGLTTVGKRYLMRRSL